MHTVITAIHQLEPFLPGRAVTDSPGNQLRLKLIITSITCVDQTTIVAAGWTILAESCIVEALVLGAQALFVCSETRQLLIQTLGASIIGDAYFASDYITILAVSFHINLIGLFADACSI